MMIVPLVDLPNSADVSVAWRIDASPERIWSCLTEPALLQEWLGTVASGSVAEGSEFEVDHGDNYRCQSQVRTYVRARKLKITWKFPDEPRTEVALDLAPNDAATDLGLTHSGLADLADSYRIGWCVHLTYLESAALGAPLPPAMFWKLRSTMARLGNFR